MIELVQFPWSPFCIVQRRILEFARVPFKITNIPSTDRSLVWKLTRQRYYAVPIIKDGRHVVFETGEDSQVIAKYLDDKLHLGLFPRELEGVQSLLWRHIENEIEGLTFRLNDVYWREFVPSREHMNWLRHKERRFGRGCADQWRHQQQELLQQLHARLIPFEEMLMAHPFLLQPQPRFVDFNLYGMLANLLFSGHYTLPADYDRLNQWYRTLSKLKLT